MIANMIRVSLLGLLVSCGQYTPAIWQSVEDIANDNAIRVELQDDAVKNDADIVIHIDIIRAKG